jgi:hypothetical protein
MHQGLETHLHLGPHSLSWYSFTVAQPSSALVVMWHFAGAEFRHTCHTTTCSVAGLY